MFTPVVQRSFRQNELLKITGLLLVTPFDTFNKCVCVRVYDLSIRRTPRRRSQLVRERGVTVWVGEYWNKQYN